MIAVHGYRMFTGLAVICGVYQIVTSCQNTDREGPPYIEIFTKETQLYFQQNQKFTLPCKACGPNIRYSWLKDGIVITKDSENGDMQLVFTNEQQGVYRCSASNKFGVSVSDEVHVNETLLIVRNSDLSSKSRGAIGTHHEFSCKYDSVPVKSTSVIWFKDSQKIRLDNRITTDYNGNLYITKVTEEDRGTYRCAISNNVMRISKTGISHIFEITSPVTSAIILLWKSEESTVSFVGDTLRLKCIFSGENYPINWIIPKEGDRENTFQTSELLIPNLTLNDKGQYQCIHKDKRFTYTFTVSIREKPYWINEPKSLELYPGATAKYFCEAAGSPTPYPKWSINGIKFEESPHAAKKEGRLRVVNTGASSTLSIQSVTKSDMMAIQCLSENIFGRVYSDVYLQILDYPATFADTTPKPSTNGYTRTITPQQDTTTIAIKTTAQTTFQNPNETEINSRINTTSNAALIGGVVGGILTVLVVVAVISFIIIYRKKNKSDKKEPVVNNQSYENVGFKAAPTKTTASYETLQSGGMAPPTTYDSLKPQSVDGHYVEIIDSGGNNPHESKSSTYLGDSVKYENIETTKPMQEQSQKEPGIVDDSCLYLEFN